MRFAASLPESQKAGRAVLPSTVCVSQYNALGSAKYRGKQTYLLPAFRLSGFPDLKGEITMLMPKRVKYRKVQRGRMRGKAYRGSEISFGEYGLQALEPGWITNRQIEAARVAMTRHIQRGGRVWIKIFPNKPVTKKPAETRMGGGKGAPEYWVAVVKPGRVLYEVAGVPMELAKEAIKRAAHKLPIKTRFITRTGGD